MNMKKGFTLIEVMIVVAIIAILAAVAIPNFIAYRENAQANACLSTVKQIENGAEAWSVQHPNDNSACTLADLWNETGTGFIKTKEAPKCAAGGTYTLEFNTTTKSYDVTCSAHEKNDDGGWVPKAAE